MRVGFLGTGAITSALVVGLSEGVAEPPSIALSPRNAAVAAELAARFPGVEVHPSNESVVDAADTLVLAVRPQDAESALQGLPYRPAQTVVSVMAGLPVAEVARLVAPATRVVRAVPLPEVARRAGAVPVFPADDDAIALFTRVGEVLLPPSEAALDAYSAVTALVAGHLDHLEAVTGWLAERDVPPLDARRYVAAVFRELSAGFDGDVPFAELADRHATRGGLNEQVREALAAAGTPQVVRQALTDVLTRIHPA